MGNTELSFVDDTGGGLASLAASLAAARGTPVRALTTAAPRVFPEVATVLAEIGITQLISASQGPVPSPRPVPGPTESDGELVVIGSAPIAGRAPALDLGLYAGPEQTAFGGTDLERLALARIARDRLERWLDRR